MPAGVDGVYRVTEFYAALIPAEIKIVEGTAK